MRLYYLHNTEKHSPLTINKCHTIKCGTELYLSKAAAKEASSNQDHTTTMYSGITREKIWSPYREEDLDMVKGHLPQNIYNAYQKDLVAQPSIVDKSAHKKMLSIVYGFHYGIKLKGSNPSGRNDVVVALTDTELLIDYERVITLDIPYVSNGNQSITKKVTLYDSIIKLMKEYPLFAAFITSCVNNCDYTFMIDTSEKLYP